MDLLFCEEEISWSPWIQRIDHPPSSQHSLTFDTNCGSSIDFFPSSFGPLDDIELGNMFDKEVDYMPARAYFGDLLQSTSVCASRNAAVKWLFEAQTCYNFRTLTTTLAVNYLDRYLAKNISKAWTRWMFELLSVACLSIAAKMEEVAVPQLIELQIGSVENAFDPATVQRMELLVLSSLGWKLRSITSASFVELMLCEMDVGLHHQQPLSLRIVELISIMLSEVQFLQFCPSIIATTAVCCALEEVVPGPSHNFKLSAMAKKYLRNNEDKFVYCYKLMEELVIDPIPPLSPSLTHQSLDSGSITSELASSLSPSPSISSLSSSSSSPPSSSLSPVSFSSCLPSLASQLGVLSKKRCLTTIFEQAHSKLITSSAHCLGVCETPRLHSAVVELHDGHDDGDNGDGDYNSARANKPNVTHARECMMTGYLVESIHGHSSSFENSPVTEDCVCVYNFINATRKRRRGNQG